MTYTHLSAGISDAEWFRRALNEASLDPVGMWQMVKAGREGFGLSGADLEKFVARFMQTLIEGGANPIIGDRSAPFGWAAIDKYGNNAGEIVKSLVAEWRKNGIDPDVDGVWFALPSVWM